MIRSVHFDCLKKYQSFLFISRVKFKSVLRESILKIGKKNFKILYQNDRQIIRNLLVDLDFSYEAWSSFCKVKLNYICSKSAGFGNFKGAGLCTFEPCCALSDQRGPRGADKPSLPREKWTHWKWKKGRIILCTAEIITLQIGHRNAALL